MFETLKIARHITVEERNPDEKRPLKTPCSPRRACWRRPRQGLAPFVSANGACPFCLLPRRGQARFPDRTRARPRAPPDWPECSLRHPGFARGSALAGQHRAHHSLSRWVSGGFTNSCRRRAVDDEGSSFSARSAWPVVGESTRPTADHSLLPARREPAGVFRWPSAWSCCETWSTFVPWIIFPFHVLPVAPEADEGRRLPSWCVPGSGAPPSHVRVLRPSCLQ